MPSHRRPSRRLVAPLIVVTGLGLMGLAAPPAPASPPPAVAVAVQTLCRLRADPGSGFLWRAIVQLLGIQCGPAVTTTTTTTTSSSSSSSTVTTRPTSTTYVPADNWGLEGYRYVVTCPGTREAPGLCSEPVATPGRVRVGNREVQTDARGWWRALGLFGPVELEGIVEPPPNRVSVCPVIIGDPSDGGPSNNRADVTCYVYFV
jgi:hypothetical protein